MCDVIVILHGRLLTPASDGWRGRRWGGGGDEGFLSSVEGLWRLQTAGGEGGGGRGEEVGGGG